MIYLSLQIPYEYPAKKWWGWLFSSFSGTFHKSREEIEIEIEQIREAQKDPRQFGPVYDRYYDQIFIYIHKRIDNLDEVAEVTSTTFTKCLANLHKFKFMGVPFSAWLYKIAINEVRLFYRSRKHQHRTVSMSEGDFMELRQETTDNVNAELALELVPKLLSYLNEKELQCVELRFFEKKSFKEIGFIMGLTEVNAKVRTYRILKKLKKLATEV